MAGRQTLKFSSLIAVILCGKHNTSKQEACMDKKKTINRRLDKATEHVSSMWFPFNMEIVRSVRAKHEKGAYDNNITPLIEDLRKDFALFSFVVKHLIPAGKEAGLSDESLQNPIILLSWAGSERICSIFQNDSDLPNNHLLESLESFQADRLRETTIIASTAEVLGEKKNLDSSEGFCAGIIREIGLNLIAWNYPTMYGRIIKSLPEGVSLEKRLAEELGFSPALLAIRVLHSSDGSDAQRVDGDISLISKTYDQLCEIGAALARAEHPERYPSAEHDWEHAQSYLKETIGQGAIDLIRERAMERSQEYESSLSTLFTSLQEFNPELQIKDHRKKRASKRNKYLPQCPKEVQAALKSLYALMGSVDTTRDVLESLVREVFPDAGFTGGCVFVIDPASISLSPRTVFGTVKLRDIRPVALNVAATDAETNLLYTENIISQHYSSDLAATALACTQPVIARGAEQEDSGVTGMYGSLGENRKVGVLYLESNEKAQFDEEQQDIITFKAVRQALADALYLD